MNRMERAAKMLLRIDAEEEISEEAQLAHEVRDAAQLVALRMNALLQVGLTRKEALCLLAAEHSAPNVLFQYGGDCA